MRRPEAAEDRFPEAASWNPGHDAGWPAATCENGGRAPPRRPPRRTPGSDAPRGRGRRGGKRRKQGTGPGRCIGRTRVAAALAAGTFVAAPSAFGHSGERGFILLLPTGLFQVGGTLAVAASFLVVACLRAGALRRWIASLRWRLPRAPGGVPGSQAAASALLLALVVAGLAGSRDPLANPLPLALWTLFWVGLTFAHAVFGHLWPHLDPWVPLARLVRRLLGRPGRGSGPLAWPEALGEWPAVALLLVFAWFELVFPAARDPAILAFAAIGYSIFTVAGMLLFGEEVWTRRVEIFSCFFRVVSWLAPLQRVTEGGERRLALVLPGSRLLAVGELPAARVAFVVVALATVSFDGLSRTFWWLDLAGHNPLEHPGRSALVGWNTLGLAGSAAALLAAFALCAATGAWCAGVRAAVAQRRFVVSIAPIAFGYHLAHYLPSFLVDAQYALKALSDPLHRGWNLLGARDFPVTASFLTHHASVEVIWYVQVGAIVAAHVAAVVVLHGLAGGLPRGDGRLAAFRGEAPLTALMIAYTLFGLWLLSTPVAA